jgi:hypothetical protein
MRHTLRLPVKLLICAAAVAGTASMTAASVPGGIASASALTLSCTTLTGSETAQSISGCTGTASKLTGTKGTSTVKNNTSKKTGVATVKWTSTKKTSIESYTYTELTGTKNKCAAKAGYVKLAEAVEKGKVTGGTATAMIGGAVTGTVCAYSKSGIHIFNLGPVKS